MATIDDYRHALKMADLAVNAARVFRRDGHYLQARRNLKLARDWRETASRIHTEIGKQDGRRIAPSTARYRQLFGSDD